MKEIILFSEKYGKDIQNFQGSGGNISFKKNGHLYIKSSGYKVSDISLKQAVSTIHMDSFSQALSNSESISSEEVLTSFIEKSNISDKKASIETGFHFLIPHSYVIHTHNVYLNVFLCSVQGISLLRDLFGENADFISYYSPGLSLFLEFQKRKIFKDITFLQNHGVVVHSDISLEDAYEKLKNVELIVKKAFGIGDFSIGATLLTTQNYLFPDAVIFPYDVENASAHSYIEKMMESLLFSPRYLSFEEKEYLTKMVQEKYRKEVVNKGNEC